MGACCSCGSIKQSPWMLSAKPSGVNEIDCTCPSRHSFMYCGQAHRSQTSSPQSTSVMTTGIFLERNFLWNQSGLKVIQFHEMCQIYVGSHNYVVYSIFFSIAGQGWDDAIRAESIARLRRREAPSRVKVRSGVAQSQRQRFFELQWQSIQILYNNDRNQYIYSFQPQCY